MTSQIWIRLESIKSALLIRQMERRKGEPFTGHRLVLRGRRIRVRSTQQVGVQVAAQRGDPLKVAEEGVCGRRARVLPTEQIRFLFAARGGLEGSFTGRDVVDRRQRPLKTQPRRVSARHTLRRASWLRALLGCRQGLGGWT